MKDLVTADTFGSVAEICVNQLLFETRSLPPPEPSFSEPLSLGFPRAMPENNIFTGLIGDLKDPQYSVANRSSSTLAPLGPVCLDPEVPCIPAAMLDKNINQNYMQEIEALYYLVANINSSPLPVQRGDKFSSRVSLFSCRNIRYIGYDL